LRSFFGLRNVAYTQLRRRVEVLRKEINPRDEKRRSHMGWVKRWLMHAETILLLLFFLVLLMRKNMIYFA
jgi:hypothetical protein